MVNPANPRRSELGRRKPRRTAEELREYNRVQKARTYARGRAMIEAAKDYPCVDCGVRLPAPCMELDHVRGEKAFNLCRWNTVKVPAGRVRWDYLAEEIAKCDVRCPNCHRLRHYEEGTMGNPHPGRGPKDFVQPPAQLEMVA